MAAGVAGEPTRPVGAVVAVGALEDGSGGGGRGGMLGARVADQQGVAVGLVAAARAGEHAGGVRDDVVTQVARSERREGAAGTAEDGRRARCVHRHVPLEVRAPLRTE